ncbi:MAG: AraC family transcriptional regulator, partial [Defluviitaleaceae bacterium]|nr:AraC family transcriptional regulator [Defluviitaleaceae bacterium]
MAKPTKPKIFFEQFETFYYFHGSSQNWEMTNFHVHDQHEILLFLSSGSTLEIGNRLYLPKSGDLFFINDKEYHRTRGLPNKSYERYVLQFAPAFFAEISAAFGYNFTMYFENRPPNFIHRINLSENNLIRIEQLFANIERNIINQADINPKTAKNGEIYTKNANPKTAAVKLNLAILELLIAINELYEFLTKEPAETIHNAHNSDFPAETAAPITQRNLIAQIKNYIKNNIEEKILLNDIAKTFFISPYYLSHYFKQETGFSLAAYITHKKIELAKTLLNGG